METQHKKNQSGIIKFRSTTFCQPKRLMSVENYRILLDSWLANHEKETAWRQVVHSRALPLGACRPFCECLSAVQLEWKRGSLFMPTGVAKRKQQPWSQFHFPWSWRSKNLMSEWHWVLSLGHTWRIFLALATLCQKQIWSWSTSREVSTLWHPLQYNRVGRKHPSLGCSANWSMPKIHTDTDSLLANSPRKHIIPCFWLFSRTLSSSQNQGHAYFCDSLQ